MAHHRNHNEIPRQFLEEICYSKDGMKLLGDCPYKHLKNQCPASCPNYNQQNVLIAHDVDKLEECTLTRVSVPPVLNQIQKFYKKYGEDWRR
jgi:hypothetical protein